MSTRIRRLGARVASVIVETVYPRVCAGCGMRGEWLCDDCANTVPAAMQPISCTRCGVPRLAGRCSCKDLDPLISMARASYVYDGWVAAAVHGTKYYGDAARAADLGARMVSLLPEFGHVDALIPVPLHAGRERERGYNQSTLIAKAISEETGVPVRDVLKRTRQTASQTRLSGEERQKNVHGAFATVPAWSPAPGKRFVLIDDVRTTGATLNACAETLKAFRPSLVGVLTFAMDMHRDDVERLRRYEAGLKRSIGPGPGARPRTAPTHPPRAPRRGP